MNDCYSNYEGVTVYNNKNHVKYSSEQGILCRVGRNSIAIGFQSDLEIENS